jgi:hypothetical protein
MQDKWKPAIDYIASVPNVNTVRIYKYASRLSLLALAAPCVTACSINPPSALPGKVHDANYDTFMQYLKSKNMYGLASSHGSALLARTPTRPRAHSMSGAG